MPDLNTLHERFRAQPVDGVVNLAGYDAAATPFVESKSAAKHQLKNDFPDQLFDLHELIFATETQRLLLVLQGLDCSGKNGTIKHVVITMNPAGVQTSSFQPPTAKERQQHFLQRYEERIPPRGQLGVFDRSHYEDVMVPLANQSMSDDEIHKRLEAINKFERKLVDEDTVLVKCLLHISFDEQRERFLRRLRRDDKRWKFAESDMETRAKWNEFQAAYGVAIGATSPDHAPWLIIPSDHKWYRNWAVASLLIETMSSLGLAYPQPSFDLEDLRRRLEPPN